MCLLLKHTDFNPTPHSFVRTFFMTIHEQDVSCLISFHEFAISFLLLTEFILLPGCIFLTLKYALLSVM